MSKENLEHSKKALFKLKTGVKAGPGNNGDGADDNDEPPKSLN